MVRSEYQNLLGQRVHFPVEKEEFFQKPITQSEDESDPFGDNDAVRYIVGYDVPPDIIQLLHNPELEGFDPFGKESELPLKYREEKADMSEIFLKQGVETVAVFDKASSLVSAYATAYNHDCIEELLFTLGPHRIISYEVRLSFYEVDALDTSLDNVWRIEDILAGNPVKLASAGSLIFNCSRATLVIENSECEAEAIRSVNYQGVDLNIDFKLDLPQLKVAQDHQLEVKLDTPMLVQIASRKNRRVVVMMINVSEIEIKND